MSKKEKTRHLGRGLQSLLSPITSMSTEHKDHSPATTTDSNLPPDKELHDSLHELDIESIEIAQRVDHVS